MEWDFWAWFWVSVFWGTNFFFFVLPERSLELGVPSSPKWYILTKTFSLPHQPLSYACVRQKIDEPSFFW